jgi:hypothetical protein
MTGEAQADRFRWWPAVAVLTLGGLVLRLAAARGGLWTDEAWSMINAQAARDPLGVFLRINHDNNHHLISLWLQAVGVHAPPMLARAPAILAGTLAIPAAALLFVRRSPIAAVAAAALFALSPIMVTYGSEARGYAPMVLAALLMLWLALGALESRGGRATPWLIALAAALGMLSNLTMLAPVGLLSIWVLLEKRSTVGAAAAIPATLALMGPAAAICGAVLALVLGAAFTSSTGLQVGGYTPFTFHDYIVALSDLTGWTVGLTFSLRWCAIPVLLAIGALLVACPPQWLGRRGRLYGILILGVPVAIALERTGNALFARYYLCSAIGLLLLTSEWIGHAVQRPGVSRAVCAAACVLFLVTAVWRDNELIQLKRGEPDRAVRIIAEQAPRGAQVAIGTERLFAPVMAAAERVDYPLAEAEGCAPAEFLIAVRTRSTEATVMHCGHPMHAIASSRTTALTGDAWVLYRQGLQTAGPPVSGPAPRRAKIAAS